MAGSAEDFVVALAERSCQGDREASGMKLLTDYRKGLLGPFALEVPGDLAGRGGGGGIKAEAAAAKQRVADSEWDGDGAAGDGAFARSPGYTV